MTERPFAFSLCRPTGSDNNPSPMRPSHDQAKGGGLAAPARRLHLICGCMFSGKTEALISRVRELPPDKVSVFKHRIDNRYHLTRVVSHAGRSCPAVPVDRAQEILERVRSDIVLVAIDEGHFFDIRLPGVCRELVNGGIDVLLTALDRDSWGRPFPVVEMLRRYAGTVTYGMARCKRCGRRATRTQRLTPIIRGRMVGGAESYEPRCLECWSPPPGSADQMTRCDSNTGPCVQQSS